MIIFTGRPLPPTPFTGARGAHKLHQGFIYSYHRVQNSYWLLKKKHDSTLMLFSVIFTCHPFQPSSISLLRVYFLISSPFNVTKLQKKVVLMSHWLAAFHSQCQWTRIFLSLTTPMAMGTQLGFKRHQGSHYSSQCSRKLWFRHFYQWIFLQIALPLCVLDVHINGCFLLQFVLPIHEIS